MRVPPGGGRGHWLRGVVSSLDFSSFSWACGESPSRVLFRFMGLRGYFLLISFFPLFSGLLSGFVCLWFSLGLEWPLLCLGGSGVLSQGAGYGVFGVCILFT